ncbi:hypothetical protein A3K29_04735 [Candidatus Collierbacteria bacterium RIFOXYB2_FULL_46_14]|uniref:Uncharacterized protein n=1 Tax=Candidatus Collierbacteria bacterium GW2011_GWA2_46_26 TaxID=1618381 RepID=A0A0G1PKB7_9BACT|nr:MAG: hypothetical protein UW29_C0005G0049 [Candidatus Collierbacteria bacterium GW2011_GWC2_44_13]KKU33117.1 MAG: hypothetical protein UX47_C0006G0088 [Candidatus Collierbacteria bacterium GW2011_GWA2_46_26]OGD73403.1 MAG: hypothetical protein A3K29_04735 [Candidatus Collierbacteria bacterium RIFOXYB2_FULL_46_14]OGD76445.1 MAG: hypothetical protein A3K43_04735 [Candidatus Collierbacteria bacterium RIFOXYA2_FULL_46_20]OGD77781.1 MAG: hypothetical protein A3K39_04735 [Candidatus Collierbacteri
MSDVYDLTVRAKIRLEQMRADSCHPADMNALVYGIMTGMNLAEDRLKVGLTEMSEQAMNCLADWSRDLTQVLEMANLYMPADKFFDADSFVHLSYRRSGSAEFYAEGLKLGFRFVYDLYAVFADMDDPRALTKRHLKTVRTAFMNDF